MRSLRDSRYLALTSLCSDRIGNWSVGWDRSDCSAQNFPCSTCRASLLTRSGDLEPSLLNLSNGTYPNGADRHLFSKNTLGGNCHRRCIWACIVSYPFLSVPRSLDCGRIHSTSF